jgi:beta-fructofuranosidase
MKSTSPEIDSRNESATGIGRRRFLVNAAKAAALLGVAPSAGWMGWTESAIAQTANAYTNLAKDPRRPQFHLLPAANWMNDPNGPIFWKGKYHMFFQYNPKTASFSGPMHWAHAVSPDMVHWKHLPIALAPTPGGPDADGCWTGTAVVRNGVVTLLYTGVVHAPEAEATIRDGEHSLRESQCYATSTDADLVHWTKRATPVIAAPPKGLQVTGFRDPTPWFQNGAWYMAVGSGIKDKGGVILLYKSSDLENWEYQHILASHGQTTGSGGVSNPVDAGDMWECPDFFELGGKHVLIYSTQGKVSWQTGRLDPKEMIFHPEQSGLLDYGSFYAPKTQLDKAGNRILWGWIQEARPVEEYRAAGWAGVMSLPRVLTVGQDGRLKIAVAPAVEKLRKHEQSLHLAPVTAGDKDLLSSARLKDACGELLCVVKPSPEPFTLDLLTPVDPHDKTAVSTQSSYMSIRYSHANPRELVVDQQRLPINLATGEPLELRFYVDGSVIELYVNNQVTSTKRFYYPGSTAPEIAVSITGKASDITRLSLWQFTPISSDRLTR